MARSVALPTAIALLGLGLAYLTRSLLEWSDLLLNRGLGAEAVAVLAVHQLVPVVTQVLPFATLIGILAGLGHLRSTGELLAVEACGVSPRRWAGPVIVFASAMALVGLWLSMWMAPASRALHTEALLALLAEHPGAKLSAGAVHEFGEHRLTAREVSSSGDALRGVVLWSPELGETLFAERATVSPDAAGGIELLLHDATALLGPAQGGGQIEVGAFRSVLAIGEGGLGDAEDSLSAATPAELRRRIDEAPPDEARLARVELHRRFALPLACLILGLAAVPLALVGGSSSRTTGTALGLLLTVGYYGLVQIGNGLLRDPGFPVEAAVWLPNLLVFSVASVSLARSTTSAGTRGGGSLFRTADAPAIPLVPTGQLILARYVASSFLQMAAVCFAALLVGYLLIDVLERLQWLARHQATALEALRFYGARVPLLMSRVGPLSLLAAASLTISRLESRGELIAMQACGVSTLRALAPILEIGLLTVPLYFFMNDALVPRANALADHLKTTEIKGATPLDESFVWYRVGGNLLQAGHMDRGHGLASEVTIYELDERGFPKSRIDADEAHALGGGNWELVEPRRVEISSFGISASEIDTHIQLGSDLSDLDTMHLGVRGLAREIERSRRQGYRTTVLEVDLQARLAAPLACLLFPLIAIAGALTGRSQRSASRSLVMSAVLAVGFLLVGDVSLSLGYGERVPPAVAAWAPMGLLVVVACGMAWRPPR